MTQPALPIRREEGPPCESSPASQSYRQPGRTSTACSVRGMPSPPREGTHAPRGGRADPLKRSLLGWECEVHRVWSRNGGDHRSLRLRREPELSARCPRLDAGLTNRQGHDRRDPGGARPTPLPARSKVGGLVGRTRCTAAPPSAGRRATPITRRRSPRPEHGHGRRGRALGSALGAAMECRFPGMGCPCASRSTLPSALCLGS